MRINAASSAVAEAPKPEGEEVEPVAVPRRRRPRGKLAIQDEGQRQTQLITFVGPASRVALASIGSAFRAVVLRAVMLWTTRGVG